MLWAPFYSSARCRVGLLSPVADVWPGAGRHPVLRTSCLRSWFAFPQIPNSVGPDNGLALRYPFGATSMQRVARLILALGCACCVAAMTGRALAAAPEYNPIRKYPVSIGPEASRVIVGFRATPGNAVTKTVKFRRRG